MDLPSLMTSVGEPIPFSQSIRRAKVKSLRAVSPEFGLSYISPEINDETQVVTWKLMLASNRPCIYPSPWATVWETDVSAT